MKITTKILFLCLLTVFKMLPINERHKFHLSQLDKILNRIYNNGENFASFASIFSVDDDNELSKTVVVFFPNLANPELEALKYLIAEGLIRENNGSYSLTFKGIMKTHTNTFVEEYENSIQLRELVVRDYNSKFFYNKCAIRISLLALLFSGISLFIELSDLI